MGRYQIKAKLKPDDSLSIKTGKDWDEYISICMLIEALDEYREQLKEVQC